MKSIRQLIEQQQQRKAPKRTRKSSDFDDCSVFITQSERNDGEEPASDEDDTENRPLVEFQCGKTERGAFCIWHQGFRFTRRRGRWFRCSNRDCDATAFVNEEGEGAITGMIGKKGHNHLPNPACFHAEQKRNKIKATTGEKPRLKPSKVLAKIRAGTKDEKENFCGWRLTLCVHALLPGKQRKYYEEALNAIKAVIAPNTPARIISDFETATIRAMRETFPVAQLTGCLFHMSQAVFRKWREMGLAELYANDEEQGEGARNSFRKLLALALIPEQHVRRGFALIVNHAPDGLSAFFGYFARVYVGLTAHEQEAGAVAFVPGTDQSRRSSISTNATEDAEYSRRNSFVNLDHVYGNNFIQFGVPSPVPSTPTTQSSTTVSVVPRWELPIVRPPLYPVHFWNVHDRARSAVEKTNNAMEASHLQFSRGLVHHPSLSDFLAAILDDVDKQVDIARSARVFPHKRRIKYILKEQLIGDALDEAEYNTDEDVMNILSLLSLQMQGYVGGLRARGAQHEHEDHESCSRRIVGRRIWDVFAREIWPIFATNIRHLNFTYGCDLENLRRHTLPTILTDLNIISIHSDDLLPDSIGDDGPNATAGQALSKWLHTPRKDGQPKRLSCCDYYDIRQKETNWSNISKRLFSMPPLLRPNERTNEKLTLEKEEKNGNGDEYNSDYWLMKRCQIEGTIQWKDKKTDKLRKVNFKLDGDSIGPLSTPKAGQMNAKSHLKMNPGPIGQRKKK
ncbi:hypothetical protein niasHT_028570 [Heterodera trifolii]|uniref:MULE transposase domain-containing protein n=1 Tax=Heterodera trifolii TaxID=157864 RepID=A0ABD2JPF2_9BILA